ncbi:hypothetical protein A9Z42_0073520 [Trichoderma parareesei]|uniref:Uncharacterized protein n=1 Tax=Trichoderma parareesei TaxID=858221 RepID=A0A2H2ZI66_TRIPA|nr:hypothetical protein A9Z42_0073520 [Trichoderma parareesei]
MAPSLAPALSPYHHQDAPGMLPLPESPVPLSSTPYHHHHHHHRHRQTGSVSSAPHPPSPLSRTPLTPSFSESDGKGKQRAM